MFRSALSRMMFLGEVDLFLLFHLDVFFHFARRWMPLLGLSLSFRSISCIELEERKDRYLYLELVRMCLTIVSWPNGYLLGIFNILRVFF